jgi:hypothetical protein
LYGQGVYGNSLDEGSRISDNNMLVLTEMKWLGYCLWE